MRWLVLGSVVPLILVPWLLARTLSAAVLFVSFHHTPAALPLTVGIASGHVAGLVLFDPLTYSLMGVIHRFPVVPAMLATGVAMGWPMILWARGSSSQGVAAFTQRTIVVGFLIAGLAAGATVVSLLFRLFYVYLRSHG